ISRQGPASITGSGNGHAGQSKVPCHADCNCHPSALEASCRQLRLVLDDQPFEPHFAPELWAGKERRHPFPQRNWLFMEGKRQKLSIAPERWGTTEECLWAYFFADGGEIIADPQWPALMNGEHLACTEPGPMKCTFKVSDERVHVDRIERRPGKTKFV